ncbi:MAG: hypothetical protein RR598_05405 [Anaerorhabdus sp.]
MNEKKILKVLLEESIAECYENDFTLIDRSMEQASVARVFFYMQYKLYFDKRFNQFSELYLDCEYNKNGDQTKKTLRCKDGTRPDLILHKRDKYDITNNKLVVEFKAEDGKEEKHEATGLPKDQVKLEDFTNPDGYNYLLGSFVKLYKSGAVYTYFEKGYISVDQGDHNE